MMHTYFIASWRVTNVYVFHLDKYALMTMKDHMQSIMLKDRGRAKLKSFLFTSPLENWGLH